MTDWQRGETFPLNVTVFNYLEQPLPLVVRLITESGDVTADRTEVS